MEIELIHGIAAVPVLVGILEVIKRVSHMEEKYVPVLAVMLGLVTSLSYQFYGETEVFIAVVRGIVLGLSSVGLYSGTKNTLEALGIVKR